VLVGGGVAVEHGCRRDFFAAEGLGDGFEGQVLGFFGGEEDAAVVGEFRGGGLVEGCDRLTAGGSLCCHLCWCCGEGLFLLAQESCSRSDSSSGCNERSSSRCDSQGGGERRGHYGQVLMKNCM